MSGFANEAYIVVTLNLLSLELKCNNPEKPTATYGRVTSHQIPLDFVDVVDRPGDVGGGVSAVAGEGSLARFGRQSDPHERGSPTPRRTYVSKKKRDETISHRHHPHDTSVTARTSTGRRDNAAANAPPDRAPSFHVYICIKSASDREAENAARKNKPAAAASSVRH